jgi:hypothetical protein
VVKATLHRSTLHHVSARDYLAYAGVLRGARLEAQLRRAEREGWAADVEALVEPLLAATTERPARARSSCGCSACRG